MRCRSPSYDRWLIVPSKVINQGSVSGYTALGHAARRTGRRMARIPRAVVRPTGRNRGAHERLPLPRPRREGPLRGPSRRPRGARCGGRARCCCRSRLARAGGTAYVAASSAGGHCGVISGDPAVRRASRGAPVTQRRVVDARIRPWSESGSRVLQLFGSQAESWDVVAHEFRSERRVAACCLRIPRHVRRGVVCVGSVTVNLAKQDAHTHRQHA